MKENPHTAVLRKILQEAVRSMPHTLTSSETAQSEAMRQMPLSNPCAEEAQALERIRDRKEESSRGSWTQAMQPGLSD